MSSVGQKSITKLDHALRLGPIRGVKGVVIGQPLVAIVFLFAFAIPEAIAYLERRVEYYAASR